MGFGGDSARQLPPQPWSSRTETSRPGWFRPYVQQPVTLAGQMFNDRLAGGGAPPPTYDDVMRGNFQSSYRPGQLTYDPLNFESLNTRPLPERPEGGWGGTGTGDERDDGTSDDDADNGTGLARNRGLPVRGLDRGGGGGARGGGLRGGGGGPRANRNAMGSDPNAEMRNLLAQWMVGAAAEPSPALGAGTDFLVGALSGETNPLLRDAAAQQRETYNAATDPSAPINQLIARQMAEGNAAEPYQTSFIDQLFSRFNAPAYDPGPIAGGRYDLLSAYRDAGPLFGQGS